jgi:hypothetical protein
MRIKKDSGNLIRGWLPMEEKMPTQVIHQSTLRTEVNPLITGLGVGLVALGLGFCFFSSYHIDGNLPVEAVLNVISHYLVGIAVGCAFLGLGAVLIAFGVKRLRSGLSIRVHAGKNLIKGWFPQEPNLINRVDSLSNVGKSSYRNFRLLSRIAILACAIPFIFLNSFSNLNPLIHFAFYLIIISIVFLLSARVDRYAKRKYLQREL